MEKSSHNKFKKVICLEALAEAVERHLRVRARNRKTRNSQDWYANELGHEFEFPNMCARYQTFSLRL